MRQFTVPVFDDFITGTAGTWYSSCAFDDMLGAADSFVVHGVTEDVTGTNAVVISLEHSANGLDWLQFPGAIVANAAPDATFMGDSNFFALGNFLTFVRLKVQIGASTSCRLKLFVCGRTSVVVPAATAASMQPSTRRVGSGALGAATEGTATALRSEVARVREQNRMAQQLSQALMKLPK